MLSPWGKRKGRQKMDKEDKVAVHCFGVGKSRGGSSPVHPDPWCNSKIWSIISIIYLLIKFLFPACQSSDSSALRASWLVQEHCQGLNPLFHVFLSSVRCLSVTKQRNESLKTYKIHIQLGYQALGVTQRGCAAFPAPHFKSQFSSDRLKNLIVQQS